MTDAEIKGCIFLMGQLWSNYKVPATDLEIDALTNTWRQFFGNASSAKVTSVICEISAEGDAFPPQIGQIYARYKGKQQVALESRKYSEEYYNICRIYAEIIGVEPPERTLCSQELQTWLENTRANA